MNKKWLILDCNYLCHRAKHIFQNLSHHGNVTGVIYGFLKDIKYFQERFDTKNIVFCWDSKYSLRKKIYPIYKQNRIQKEITKEELKFEISFRKQVKKLRLKYLPVMGYKNNFIQKGYEADDIIASICLNLNHKDEAIIISSDHDLFQLIRFNVSICNLQKRRILTLQSFKREFGILPDLWTAVKCRVGCHTDNIIGIPGVGEKTALKYFQGKLKKDSKLYKKITSKSFENLVGNTNYNLIHLPFGGVKTFQLQQDVFSQKGWKKVCEELGLKSLKKAGFANNNSSQNDIEVVQQAGRERLC